MSQEDLDYTNYYQDEPAVEEVAVEEAEVVVVAEPEVAAEPIAKSKKSSAAAAVEPEVVYSPPASSALELGEVRLSSLVFEGNSVNSRSVALVQERLVELSFYDAGSDNRGWLGAGTKKALADFAGLSVEEVVVDSEELIKRLFAGTQVSVSK
jgi:hypothetical protein